MKIFTCTDHDNQWVGVASVIIANNKGHAKMLLDQELINKHLKPYAESPYTLTELDINKPQAIILQDGDY